MEIKSIGKYLEFDKNNFLINPTNIKNIDKNWLKAIKKTVELINLNYKKYIISVYLRGSVPRGLAVDNISDLDFLIIIDNNYEKENFKKQNIEDEIIKEFNFVDGVELSLIFENELNNNKNTLLFNQALFIQGEKKKIKKIKFGKSLVLHLPSFERRADWYKEWIALENSSKEKNKKNCTWMAKGIIRAGLELKFEEGKKYTRDLYLCWELFSKYYPEKKEDMFKILNLAINPISDKKKIKEVIRDMHEFILNERNKKIL